MGWLGIADETYRSSSSSAFATRSKTFSGLKVFALFNGFFNCCGRA